MSAPERRATIETLADQLAVAAEELEQLDDEELLQLALEAWPIAEDDDE